jgi:hypothetical protein
MFLLLVMLLVHRLLQLPSISSKYSHADLPYVKKIMYLVNCNNTSHHGTKSGFLHCPNLVEFSAHGYHVDAVSDVGKLVR